MDTMPRGMDVYIVSCPATKDRLSNLLSCFSSEDTLLTVHSAPSCVFTLKRPNLKRAYWDQYKKYIRIFRLIAAANRPCLVLEDDALPKPNWRENLAEAPADFDFLFLSDDYYKHPLQHVEGPWYAARHSKTTCATVYSVKAAKLLARRWFYCSEAIDWTINRLLEREKSLKAYWHISGLFEHGSMTGRYASSITPVRPDRRAAAYKF